MALVTLTALMWAALVEQYCESQKAKRRATGGLMAWAAVGMLYVVLFG